MLTSPFFHYVTLYSIPFDDPLPSLYCWALSVGGEDLKWHQPAHHKPRSQQGPHFSPRSTAKTND